jgi:ACS family hexuronate transporter-like MFS transporter
VVGIGGLAGALGATLFPLFVGAVLDHFKLLGNIGAGYNVIFVICGSAYLIAWLLMRVIRASRTVTDVDGLQADAS